MKDGFCNFEEIEFCYFDYAATTFMPQSVVDVQNYYVRNIGVSSNRGKSVLSVKADEVYDYARKNIKSFFLSESLIEEYELVFYQNSSHAINEIAYGIEHEISQMDIILIGPFEHHSNYLPWRELAKRTGAILFEMPLDSNGKLDKLYLRELKDRIKLISFSSISNSNGFSISVNELQDFINESTMIIIDDSQKCAHSEVEQNTAIDVHILSSHKMYGPKGVAGALIKKNLLEKINPVIFGGGMVERVGFPNIWKRGYLGLECGTTDVACVNAWSEACNYIRDISFVKINEEELKWYQIIIGKLRQNENIEILSDVSSTSIIAFTHRLIHAHDIEQMFSDRNIVIRSGNLCSQNSIAKLGAIPVVRISIGYGVDYEDVKILITAIEELL